MAIVTGSFFSFTNNLRWLSGMGGMRFIVIFYAFSVVCSLCLSEIRLWHFEFVNLQKADPYIYNNRLMLALKECV